MTSGPVIQYLLKSQLELNLSYIPFIANGGLFIPTTESYSLSQTVWVDLQLPGQIEAERIEGRVVWITPKSPHYGIYQGIGIQFVGTDAVKVCERIVSALDNTMEIGSYTYGMVGESNEKSRPQKSKV